MPNDDELPEPLRLTQTADSVFTAPRDEEREARGYPVYGGQLLGQMIMAGGAGGDKAVQSIHAVFARAGSYAEPLEYHVDRMHDGRSFASSTVTCRQGDRLVARGLLLLTVPDPHFLDFQRLVATSDVPTGPGVPDSRLFPGSLAVAPSEADASGQLSLWTRHPDPVRSPLANQAMLAWGTDGYLIAAALGPHPGIDESQAHDTISTGVVSHSVSFHGPVDMSQWILLAHEHVIARNGRAFGRCSVFAAGGEHIASFSQDAMVRPRTGRGPL